MIRLNLTKTLSCERSIQNRDQFSTMTNLCLKFKWSQSNSLESSVAMENEGKLQ